MANAKICGVTLNPSSESLADGTLALQQGECPGIIWAADSEVEAIKALKRKDGTWDFGQNIDFDRYNMVELIQDEASALYNFGPILVSKMKVIKAEGQVYYWKIDAKKRYTPEQQREYEARKRNVFVKFGDGSDPTPVGKKGKKLGDFDRLVKWEGTTNCSTAVLDALYRALGGKVSKKGKILKIGGVNGVPLSDSSFSGFAKKFQGADWDAALVEYGLGYKVAIRDLKHGDIISTGGHRMVYLKTIKADDDGMPTRIKAIQAQLPTGNIAVQNKGFNVGDHWKAGRIFDIRL